jgi:hypothetical protein
MTQMMRIMKANAAAKPTVGDRIPGMITLSQMPSQLMTSGPDAAIADPATPPMSAWLELDGKAEEPRDEVPGDRADEAGEDDAQRDRVGVHDPLRDRRGDRERDECPRKLRIAARTTAVRGVSARVETLVAIAFAVSWNPFVKSKKSAVAMTAARVRSSTTSS